MAALKKLTNLQIELLKLFQFDLPENQLAEIKNMLAKYFANKATAEMLFFVLYSLIANMIMDSGK